jgi:signal transduction histidine kinase
MSTILHVPTLLFSPNDSVTCLRCSGNLVVVTPEPRLANALLHLELGGAIGVLVAGCVVLARRWTSATAPERRALAPVLWCGGATGVLAIVAMATAFAGLREVSAALDWAYLTLFAAIPFAFLAGLLRSELRRADAVYGLVERLSEAATRSSLREALAEALDDPSLQIAYWLPGEGCYVDEVGRTIALPLSRLGEVTEIERNGRRIAAIMHDRSLAEESDLLRAARAVAALGVEREHLNAELRSHIEELRASRARIVQASDSERRKLERDLHDGAQQRLVSAIFRLNVARGDLAASPEVLEAVQAELRDALEDLRRLASGILPPVLGDHGLAAAVEDLADRSPVEVLIGQMPSRRLPESIEIAAYFVIAEALTNAAKHAEADRIDVCAVDNDDGVTVEVSDDGVGGARPAAGSGLTGLVDRVGALGGHLAIESPARRGTTIRAHIPYRPRSLFSSSAAPAQQRGHHTDARRVPPAGEIGYG